MSNITIFYHKHCADGLMAAVAVSEKLPAAAVDMIAVQYGDITEENYRPQWEQYVKDKTVYIVDFSVKPAIFEMMLGDACFVNWVDHHKTAFEDYGLDINERYWGERLPGWESKHNHAAFLWNEMSGAELAWLASNLPNVPASRTPDELREDYLPAPVKYVGDRDLWRWQYDETRDFVAGLFGDPSLFDIDLWRHSLQLPQLVDEALRTGKVLNRAHDSEVAQLLTGRHAVEIWVGDALYHGHACNAPAKYASDLGHDLARIEGTFGLVWRFDGQNINCSLRGGGNIDVSAIAKHFGGGGHHNAAGFSCTWPTLMQFLMEKA